MFMAAHFAFGPPSLPLPSKRASAPRGDRPCGKHRPGLCLRRSMQRRAARAHRGVAQFLLDQAVEFGAHVGHAAGDHQARAGAAALARLHHPNHAQRPCGRAAHAFVGARRAAVVMGQHRHVAQVGIVDGGATACIGMAADPGLDRREKAGQGEQSGSHVELLKAERGLDTGRIADEARCARVMASLAIRPPPGAGAESEQRRAYISMVLRIRPTARPSISKGSPGCTTMVG